MLLPFLKPVLLTREAVLYEPGAEIEECFFLGSSLVSCVNIMRAGESAEIGLMGYEGVTGESILVDGGYSSSRVCVRVAGMR